MTVRDKLVGFGTLEFVHMHTTMLSLHPYNFVCIHVYEMFSLKQAASGKVRALSCMASASSNQADSPQYYLGQKQKFLVSQAPLSSHQTFF